MHAKTCFPLNLVRYCFFVILLDICFHLQNLAIGPFVSVVRALPERRNLDRSFLLSAGFVLVCDIRRCFASSSLFDEYSWANFCVEEFRKGFGYLLISSFT